MKSAIVGLGVIGSVHASILEGQERAPVAVCDIVRERLERIHMRITAVPSFRIAISRIFSGWIAVTFCLSSAALRAAERI